MLKKINNTFKFYDVVCMYVTCIEVEHPYLINILWGTSGPLHSVAAPRPGAGAVAAVPSALLPLKSYRVLLCIECPSSSVIIATRPAGIFPTVRVPSLGFLASAFTVLHGPLLLLAVLVP